LHASTERRIAPAVRLRDVDSYARLLAALYPLYAFIEDRLEAFAEWPALDPPLDVRRRRRSHLLAADLGVLGLEPDPGRVHNGALPRIAEFASAFGALYVIEGSKLGGRVLARQVSAAVGAPAEGALAFLRGGGSDDAGALWKELLATLDGYATQSDAATRDAILAGAVETFDCFDRRLARWDP
jgi:heme oxygenase (biliverdin-IX-beta and delta-forming)